MAGFDAQDLTRRIGRPLSALIATLLVLGVGTVLTTDDAPGPDDAEARNALAAPRSPDEEPPSVAEPGASTASGTGAVGGGADSTAQPTDPGGSPTDTDPAVAGDGVRGPAVPAVGTYRYRVTTSVPDGAETVSAETRTFEDLGADEGSRIVRLSVVAGEQEQVSDLRWGSNGVVVLSTSIASPEAGGSPCTWSPPFTEVGGLAEGVSWAVDSSCDTDVGGIPTRFQVSGQGAVVGPEDITVAGVLRSTWRIERTRITDITADGGLRQTATESGQLWIDPVAGVVVRSSLTVRLDGVQSGSSTRTVELVE